MRTSVAGLFFEAKQSVEALKFTDEVGSGVYDVRYGIGSVGVGLGVWGMALGGDIRSGGDGVGYGIGSVGSSAGSGVYGVDRALIAKNG